MDLNSRQWAAGSICVSKFPWTVAEPHDYGNGADDSREFGPQIEAEMAQRVPISFSAVWQSVWCQAGQMVHIYRKLDKKQKVVNLNV